ncbi:contractile injection system tape measure protein [Rhizobacter sp. P5_C2]
MAERHFLAALELEVDFARFPQTLPDEAAAEQLLADFACGPMARVVDSAFDDAVPADETWRLDTLQLDLGDIVVEEGRDWSAAVADAFARSLARHLAELREAPEGGAQAGHPRPVAHRRAQLEQLLFFLRHGHMPWYARGRFAAEPRALGQALLQQDARGLAAALRASPDRALLLRRLATQFEADWLQALVQALLPDEPAAAWRVLRALREASPTGRAEGVDADAELWEAALEGVFARASGAAVPPERAVMRLQLKRALDAGAALDDASLSRTVAAWRGLLREDRAWLRSILQRHGGAPALQRRLVRLLPTGLLAQVAGLWLDGRRSQALAGWIAAVAGKAPARPAQAADDVHRVLWEATLLQLWADRGEAAFDGHRFAREVRERAGLQGPGDVRDDALLAGTRPSVADLDAERWARLRQRPDEMREALRRAVREGDAARIVQQWPDALLLEAAGLQWPDARPWLAAAIASPTHDAATRARRWVHTLERACSGRAGTAFDPDAYVEDLVHEEARHAGIEPDEAARRWSDEMQAPAAEAAWVERIVNAEVAPQPARSFARKVADTVASLASSMGKRLGRLWSTPLPESAQDAAPSIEVDNAGLVLLGRWMPPLFSRLGLLQDDGHFTGDAARARAVHLLQFAVDGLDEPAAESRLVLNKLFCGLPPRMAIDRRFAATAQERAVVQELLGAALSHWSALGGTSVAGLRETFLQRGGRLERGAEGGWSLAVEPGPVDMLLDTLPWGYSLQKLTWMEEMLHVSWR